jgi:hypothetical protein
VTAKTKIASSKKMFITKYFRLRDRVHPIQEITTSSADEDRQPRTPF